MDDVAVMTVVLSALLLVFILGCLAVIVSGG